MSTAAGRTPPLFTASYAAGNVFAELTRNKESSDRRRRLRRKRSRSRSRSRDANDEELPEPHTLVPESRPGLLRDLSVQTLRNEPVRISAFNFMVTRECEQFARNGTLDEKTRPRDLERLARSIDDFMLQHRDSLDRAHRLSLWISICKLCNLRFNVIERQRQQGNESSSTGSSVQKRVRDPLRLLALDITNEQLARWMYENETHDETVVQFDAASGQYQHTLQSCGVTALWNTILALKDRWPYLPLSAYVHALVAQLRQRVAFFMSYRERLDKQSVQQELPLLIHNIYLRKKNTPL